MFNDMCGEKDSTLHRPMLQINMNLERIMKKTHCCRCAIFALLLLTASAPQFAVSQLQPVIPKDKRGRTDAERSGQHDAGNIRTIFHNYGMVGDYPSDPLNVDLTTFHSVEVPKGSGMNYSDGVTPFVLAKVRQTNGIDAYIMETGFRERQVESPFTRKIMRFEPRPGYFEADPALNRGRSIALSNDKRTWPASWPDKANDPDPGWAGSWNGYFGKRANADQESFSVMDDDFYDAWSYYPDARDATRRGLGLRVEVRGFQWANPQAANVVFWHYDITNESTTDYNDNIIFGLYMDSGVGGEAISCDGIAESDDDNAYFDHNSGLNLVYTWDKFGHGADLRSNCSPTGYLGYAYMETPGNSFDGIDNDNDGIVDEKRDSSAGTLIEGQANIRAYAQSHYDMAKFQAFYGQLATLPAFKAGRWWTGDENMNWVADYDDVGADGIPGTQDQGELDGRPTQGEPDFGQTDKDESDQIGLTGFKMNRIKGPSPTDTVDAVVFYGLWPPKLYQMFTNANPSSRFDSAVVLNYNIGFLFASGPFKLPAGAHERFSLALTYGSNLTELRAQVRTVQQIYNANYQFAVPPPAPAVTAESGDKFVRLSWTDISERGIDPITHDNDFEGYRIFRSTDPEFQDSKTITNGHGTGTIGNGKSIAQFDLKNGITGFSHQQIDGVAFYLGTDSGLMHTFVDTTVRNGQTYYYAVCAYDRGSDSLEFSPSENAISVSRTLRGGTILPPNVVEVRPEPKVFGYTPAEASNVRHLSGTGTADVSIKIVNSKLVPDNKTYLLKFVNDDSTRVHATRYQVVDSVTQKPLIEFGNDFLGEGRGAVGLGMLPIINTPETSYFDSASSGFTPGSVTNARLKVTMRSGDSINVRRPGFPYDFTITFSNTYIDTTLQAIGSDPIPVKFRVVANTPTGPLHLKCTLNEPEATQDSTLSAVNEFIDINTRFTDGSNRATWRVQLDTVGQSIRGTLRVPGAGDIYEANIISPVSSGDVYVFKTTGQMIDGSLAKDQYKNTPYVVPNPYVGAASFEPAPFGVTGRGDRRLEFRGLPAGAAIRIYTVRGELVQTLRHDGSTEGFVAWNLRTKDNLDVAPGLYVYHVEVAGFNSYIGKFGIIK